MLVRKALLQDASNVYDLVNSLSSDGTLLKRAFAEICENIRDFTVAESDGGVFLGCGALHLYGPHLSEVRSIVVKPEAKGQGAGGRILGALIEEAEEHGVQSVCLFTRIPDFFFKYGFRTVEDKAELPDKIFKDCQMCPRLHRCDEVAMVRGRIPRMSILGPREEAQQLVRLSGMNHFRSHFQGLWSSTTSAVKLKNTTARYARTVRVFTVSIIVDATVTQYPSSAQVRQFSTE